MAKYWKAFLILLINSCLPVTAVYIVKPVNNYQAFPINVQDQPDHQYSLESVDPGDEAYQDTQLKNLRVNEIKGIENQDQSLFDVSNKLQRMSADNLVEARVATFNPPWFNRYGRAVIDVEHENLRKGAIQTITNLAPVTVAEESLENADRRALEKEPRESTNINAAPVWSSRLRKETLKRNLNPLWGSRFGRERDGLITQPLWSARFGRAIDSDSNQPLWSARFGREDSNNKADPLWGSRHGRRTAEFDSQPIESAKIVRTVNFDTRKPLWNARFGRETISNNLAPIWSSRFGRDIISNSKVNPPWGARYGREIDESNIQPLWNARFGREVNVAAKQPLWSARFGREAFIKNMAPVSSSRDGRGISKENLNPIWGSRYGREIDESNSQPLWSSRFGRVVNANTRTQLWSSRFEREATPNQIAPIWSSRFGRETKDFDLDVHAVPTNEKEQSEQKGVTVAKMPKRRVDGEDIAGDQEITEKEERIFNSLGEGFADDSTGSRFLYGISQLKKAIKRNANGRQGGIAPLIKLFKGTLKVKETGPKKQSNQESADISKMKWRKATKEELQRLDDVIHGKIDLVNADE